mgnify:CR=1 FL=1
MVKAMIRELKEALNIDDLLIEQAMPQRVARAKVESLSDTLLEHFALIGMLGKSHRDYEHWKNEIANFCKQLDNILVKKNRKLDRDTYIDYMYHLDTDRDAEIDVNAAWVNHRMDSILNYNFTREDYKRYRLFRNECFEELAELFSEKENHSREFFKNFIESKVNKYFE